MMAKMPSIEEIAKNASEKALNGVIHGRTLRKYIEMISHGEILELGRDYSSADYKIVTEDHKDYQTFRIQKRR